MSSLSEVVRKMVVMSLRDNEVPTSQQIRQHITAVVQMQRQIGRAEPIDEEALYREVLSQVNTWQADPSILRDGKHHNWLPGRKAQVQWNFWKRYRQYLEDEKTWPAIVTAKLDKVTDSILGDIGNPVQAGNWDRRGMVVGEVQSGKTANYTGLICKAVDSGYKLIIVLAGMTNDLRSQTQSRLDAEFLGFESEVGKIHSTSSRIGVGKIEDYGQLIAHPLTYSAKDGDFRANKSANLQLGGTPILLVVKKNASVLGRILTWVKNQGKPHPETGEKVVDGIPLLLLDDEADNASVNTKSPDEDPTSINRAIRQILNSFQQRSYVGYTATPFANIFILPDEDPADAKFGPDLFPKGFIYYIPPPTNYLGASRLFGLDENLDGAGKAVEGLPLICDAEDADVFFPRGHKKNLAVTALPYSLIRAVKSFIITCAARRARGQTEVHNSMLIHVTRFNDVQQQVMGLVDEVLIDLSRTIEFNTGAQAAELMDELQELWEESFVPITNAVLKIADDPQITSLDWNDVRAELLNAVTRIQVRGINGNAGGVLDYDNNPSGLTVIAVGGDKLSRGLTLEGLSVSYYIRPARNYDTLLQMGRWFGYRPGYLDLCRLYVPEELNGWYQHVAVANEELRREFNFMELGKLTPEEYGLKVRTSPDGLNITAANKIRHGRRMRVSFAGHLAQTTIFHKDSKVHEDNFDAAEKWLKSLAGAAPGKTRIQWEDVTPEQVTGFLGTYTTHPLCRQAEPDLLIKYIQKLAGYGELQKWTVVLASSSDAKAKIFPIAGFDVGLVRRGDATPERDLYMLNNANILSPQDEMIDLSKEQIQQALHDNIEEWKRGTTRSRKEPVRPSGPFIRRAREPESALLLLYPIDHEDFREPFSTKPVIGFAISFPGSPRGELGAVEYEVNTRYWNDRYGEDDDENES